MSKTHKPTKKVLSIASGRAFTGKGGAVNDSIGRVIYAMKVNPKILLENLIDSGGNTELRTPLSQTIVNIPGTASAIDCFYKFLSTVSYYYQPTQEDDKFTGEVWTNPAVNVYKIQLQGGINTLEIRNNDPWNLSGVDSTPFDFFRSIAITKSEVSGIVTLLNTAGITKVPTYFNLGTPIVVNNAGYRTYYKTTLLVDSSKPAADKTKASPINTGIILYSVDNYNWVSVNYANAAYPLIMAPTWNNQTIPIPVSGTNPFGTNWPNIFNALTSIMSEADNLPVANDKKGYRLLNTPVRDYIYSGDLNRLTFEIAFRLPFFMEDFTVSPYSLQNNNRINNPYYTKFTEWFGLANSIRTSAGYTANNLLSRTGLVQSVTNAIQATPDHLSLYALFYVARLTNPSFTNQHVFAYMAKVMEDENPYATYISKNKNVIHFPAIIGSDPATVYKTPDNGATLNDVLTHLETIGVISIGNNHAVKQYLLTGAVNSFAVVASPSAQNGYYLVKSSATSLFIIKNLSINSRIKDKNSGLMKNVPDPSNFSGWTVGLGYDIGQNDEYDKFINYTKFNINNATDEAIYQEAMGNKRERAAALYLSFKDTVIPKYQLSYDTAVTSTISLIKGYLTSGLQTPTIQKFLVIPSGDDFYFFNANTTQYLNEIEKMMFLSELYNGGINAYKSSHRAVFIVHALNTHDYRWLKHFANNPKPTGLSCYPARKTALISFMNYRSTYNHYNLNKVPL